MNRPVDMAYLGASLRESALVACDGVLPPISTAFELVLDCGEPDRADFVPQWEGRYAAEWEALKSVRQNPPPTFVAAYNGNPAFHFPPGAYA